MSRRRNSRTHDRPKRSVIVPSVKSTARYVFSVSILAIILYLFDANDVLTTMVSADFGSVLIAVGLALSSQVFSAIRLNRLALLQDISLSFGRVFLIGLSAVFYGLVVPGGAVAAFAARFVQLSENARVESVAASLVVDRVIATVFLIAVGTIAIAFDKAEPLWAVVIAAGTVFSAGIFVFGRRLFLRLIDRLDNASSRDSPSRLRGFSERIIGAFLKYSTAGSGQILIVLAASLLAHLCGCLSYFTIAKSLGLNITFLSICWIRSGMILSTMIPVSVAGLGLREVAAIGLLVPLGVGEAQAVGFSILIFLVTPVIVGLIGGSGELLRLIGPTEVKPLDPNGGV
jgi:uncharacterized protein (TIRG00374 family)